MHQARLRLVAQKLRDDRASVCQVVIVMLGDKIHPVQKSHRLLQPRVNGDMSNVLFREQFKPSHQQLSAGGKSFNDYRDGNIAIICAFRVPIVSICR